MTRSLDHKSTSLRRAREVKPRSAVMSSFSHLFQDQAQSYAEFRPSYPKELYDILFEYIGKDSPMEHALDIATGSGQAAIELAKKFEKVPDLIILLFGSIGLGIMTWAIRLCMAFEMRASSRWTC